MVLVPYHSFQGHLTPTTEARGVLGILGLICKALPLLAPARMLHSRLPGDLRPWAFLLSVLPLD